MMSMELQQLSRSISDPQPDASEKVEALIRRTAQVISDVHALSHQLHSAKLEVIGLIPTMKGFCRELAEQRNVEIDFTHGDVPDNVSLSLSVCLFRVLQEGLNNAVKHSGVRRFEARIREWVMNFSSRSVMKESALIRAQKCTAKELGLSA